jgi:DNA-binding response OmpR family regulator
MTIRVIIADADTDLLERYKTHLVEHGLKVQTATTALDCVERLRAGRPDILVLEPAILWGGGDGVLELMRVEPDVPSVPVIVVSSRAGWTPPPATRFAVAEYHAKPLSPEELLKAILRNHDGRTPSTAS